MTAAFHSKLRSALRDPNEVGALMEEYNSIRQESVRNETSKILSTVEEQRVAAVAAGATATPVHVPISPPKRTRKKRAGNVELEDTERIKHLKEHEKLDFILAKEAELLLKAEGEKERLTENHKRWYNRHISKVLLCLNGCFRADTIAFVLKYGDFKTSKFECTCRGN
jgi:hypothetical protein